MSVITPTITTDDAAVFQHNLTTFSQFAKRIQIDVSDGTFAPTTTVQIPNMPPMPEGVQIDLHLMAARPSDHLGAILTLKPKLCILHGEVDDDLPMVFSQLKENGIKVGLALVKTTFPGQVSELISVADHAMIFAGELGRQGGTIDMMQIEKVPLIRQIKPNIEVGWDGGTNLSNVRALAHADIDVINVGSAISQAADPAAMYQSLIAESEKKGVLI